MGMQTRLQHGANSLKQEGKQVAHNMIASPVMETLMRLGYIVRGLVYGMIGLLAFQVATGSGAECRTVSDSSRARNKAMAETARG